MNDVSLFKQYFDKLEKKEAARQGVATLLGAPEPDRVAESLDLGRQLDLPAQAVLGAPEIFRTQAAQQQATTALTGAPNLTGWVSDPLNGGLVKDDLQNLSWFEKNWKPDPFKGEGAAALLKRRGQEVVAGFGGVLSSFAEARSIDERALANALQDQAPVRVQEAARQAERFQFILDRGLSDDGVSPLSDQDRALYLSRRDEALQAVEQWADVEEFGPALGGREYVAERAVQSLEAWISETFGDAPVDDSFFSDLSHGFGSMLGFLLPNVVPGAGLAGTAQLGADAAKTEAYQRAINQGASEDEAFAASQIAGFLGTTEAIPIGRALNFIPEPVRKGLLGRIGRAIVAAGKGGAEEAAQEGFSAIMQNLIAQRIYDPEQDLLTSDVGRQALVGAVLGGFLGGGATFVSDGAAQAVSDLDRQIVASRTSGETAAALEEIDAMAAASKVKGRSVEKFDEALSVAGLNGQPVYVAADAIREYFQAKDVQFDADTLREWGIEPEEFELAEQSGGAVAVPVSSYAARISGTDDAAWFRDNATFDPDEMSLAEAREFNRNVREVMEEAFEEAERERLADEESRASDVQVYDTVFSQLRVAGRSPDVAKNEAQVFAAFWRTIAERYGDDALDLSRRFGFEIRGPQSENAPRRRGDLDVRLNALRANPDRALAPRGLSLTEWIIDRGGLRDLGGDVAALDPPRGLIAESYEEAQQRAAQGSLSGLSDDRKGDTLDNLGRAAIEAGFFPDLLGGGDIQADGTVVDEASLILDAIAEEIAGRPIYRLGEEADPENVRLSNELSRLGIDLALSNDEIVAALQVDDQGRTLFQDDYRGMHTAPLAEDGNASLADLTDVFGSDIYGPNAVRYYGTGNDKMDFLTIQVMRDAAANPDKPIKIYRAVPAGVSDQINSGDWVTINRDYAEQHGEYFDEYDVIEMLAMPHQIITDGNSIHEFGYDADAPLELKQGADVKRGSIAFPSGGLEAGTTIINLFESADLSTFLHESGHYFLEAFTALASDPDAPQQMRDDLGEIREWLGLEDGESPAVEHHEKWARGFEAYALEGKAPSLALADAFSRFKAWLTRIYKTVRGLNVKLSPEIREVMDRMLATDEEIAQMRAEIGMRPLFRDGAPAGMSEADFRTYQRISQRSEAEAERRLLERTMAKVRREREAWFKDERKAVLKEVSTEFNRLPQYRLVEALANGTWFDDDGTSRQIPADMRIDRGELVEQFGDGILAELSRTRLGGKRAIYESGGESPSTVAEFFGFSSPIQMVESLQNAGKRKEAIKAEVERRLVERHGDPLNDGSIEEEALRVIHNKQQGETIAAEARHLAGRIGRSPKQIKTRLFRQRAKLMLGQMSVQEAAKPERFLAAERAAAKRAEAAFARVARSGREAALSEAYQAKEQQLLNHMLYTESRDFAATLQRGRERMRSYAKKSVREKLAGGYIEQIDALLEQYDFRVRSGKAVARSESLANFVDRMVAEGREAELSIDVRLIDQARKTHYSRLSVDELRGLFDTIANIDHLGRFKQKLIERDKKRRLDESASRVASSIRKSYKAGRAGQEIWGMSALNLIRKPDTMLVAIDGGAEMGPAYEELKASIDAGQALEQQMQVEMAEKFDALFKAHYDAASLRNMQKERKIDGVSQGLWAKVEVIALALNTGNEDNFQRVMDQSVAADRKMTPETVGALLGTLTENDWRFVQGMWDLINGYWPDLAAVHKRRTGVEPDKVQGKVMFDGAPDFVRGGYYPIKYDTARGDKAAKDEASAWDQFFTAGHGSTAAVKNGMTKQRQKSGGGRTLLYDLSVPFTHLRDTVRFIAMSEAVDATYRVLNHSEVVEAFQDVGMSDAHKTLNLWVKDVARGPIFNTDFLNAAARMIKNNFTLARLAFNLKTVILQATGLGQSAATIGKKNMVRGMATYAKHPAALVRDVVARSPMMAERQTTFQKDIYDFANDVKISTPLASRWSKLKGGVGKYGFWMMTKVQFLVVDMPTWVGAYDAALAEGKTEDQAAKFADRMVVRAQDSALFADRSPVERGTVSENVRQADFIRLFTTLGGYMLTKLNRAQVTAIQAQAGIKEAEGAAAKSAVAISAASDMMLLFAFEAVMMGMIYSIMSDDEDDEDLRDFIVSEMGMAVVGGIPLVRDAASAFRGYGGGGVYGSVMEIPANLFKQTVQGENDKALRRSVGDLVGTATGLPTTAALRVYESILGKPGAPLSEALMGSNPLTR